jgi:hypothetical protein
LVYSHGMREAAEFGGPEWCLFCLNSNGEVPNIEEQFRLLVNLWVSDGFYVTKYFLSRVGEIKTEKLAYCSARYYNFSNLSEDDADNPDARMAMSQWKVMLEDIYTVKYLANLADTKPLALSSSIKRSMTGRGGKKIVERFRSGLKSWDMVRVKREFVEGVFQ